ncbi:CIC11C00000003995 [Sungouiella intermedia]|uniref:CIC11C00000003995 n=1 Tax=Sungouiella intermedia TaxID=45354 RepID=A0A1L0DPI1_9ASCO|nr:CIC11C00000003995 [[Candida] intermedia]
MSEKHEEIISVSNVISHNGGITTFMSPHTGKPVHMIGDNDVAMEFAEKMEDFEVDPEEEKKLVKKIDMYLLPLICILYALQFMDKNSLNWASVLGLRKDLKMHGQMYSWAGSAFYYGYLFFEFFTSMSIQRFPIVYVVSIYIVLWGVILCLHSVPQYPGFIVLRVILGGMESAITPAFVIITGQWYTKDEIFLRTAIWFSSNGAGTLIGSGGLAYNIYQHRENFNLAPWKLIFIINGVITIGLGLIIPWHIPNKPTEAWFLNDREKKVLVQRIKRNQQGFGNKHFKKEQLYEALMDRRTWAFFLIGVTACIPNGGISNFGAILLSTKLGYSTSKTLLMGMPHGAVEFGGCIFFCWLYRFYKVRLFWGCAGQTVTIISFCFLAFAHNTKVEYAGYALTSMLVVTLIVVESLIASNVAGHTKKVVTNAIFLIGYCAGNLIGPQTFKEDQAPQYTSACIAMVVCACICMGIMILLWIDYALENKRREARMNDPTVVEFLMIANHEFADLTDKQNPLFRYAI